MISGFKKQSLRQREAFIGLGFVAPALLLLLAFGFVPLILAGYTSLYKYPLTNPDRRQFIEFANFARAFQDAALRKAFVNTIYYALLQTPLQTILGLLLAMLVNKTLGRSTGFFRAGYYLPVVISMVVASTLWGVMLDSEQGLINSTLSSLGLPRQPLLTSTKQALPTLAVMLSWKWMGFSMLIFLAGLQAIPTEYYEAAQIDGAGGLARFWYITLPLLRRPALFVIVTNTIHSFKLFTPIFIMTEGGPLYSTLTVVYYTYREAFSFGRLGYGSAIAVIFTVFLLLLAAAQLRILRSEAE